MSRDYPALEVRWAASSSVEDTERLLAALDETGITAVADHGEALHIFFASPTDRDRAQALAASLEPHAVCIPIAVPDEGWAERSQAALQPVRVDGVVITPPWAMEAAAALAPAVQPVVIQPSMGFGTGHHASTRLVLALLQRRAMRGRSMLDVGTGSGVLAIACALLGAEPVLALDYDADALSSAAENLELNGLSARVTLRQFDIGEGDLTGGPFHVITANLTGAMLIRHAERLAGWLAIDGVLIASGFQTDETPAVREAFAVAGITPHEMADEETWVAISASPISAAAR